MVVLLTSVLQHTTESLFPGGSFPRAPTSTLLQTKKVGLRAAFGVGSSLSPGLPLASELQQTSLQRWKELKFHPASRTKTPARGVSCQGSGAENVNGSPWNPASDPRTHNKGGFHNADHTCPDDLMHCALTIISGTDYLRHPGEGSRQAPGQMRNTYKGTSTTLCSALPS